MEYQTIPLIYIAGPYRAETREGVELNIQAARAVARICAAKGWMPVCPHTMLAHLESIMPSIPDKFWLMSTMALMERCDAVMLVPGWQASSGAMGEVAAAQALGMQVYIDTSEVPVAASLAGLEHSPRIRQRNRMGGLEIINRGFGLEANHPAETASNAQKLIHRLWGDLQERGVDRAQYLAMPDAIAPPPAPKAPADIGGELL